MGETEHRGSDSDQLKHCSRCDQDKPVDDFHWKVKEKGWRQPYCKPCAKSYARTHYENNKQYYIAKARASDRNRFQRKQARMIQSYGGIGALADAEYNAKYHERNNKVT